MRAGGYTVHQALSADAAAVLKLALALARRRGHAQLTPLHVAFTLLRSSSSSSSSPSDPPPFACSGGEPSCCAHGLLRRACVRAHPAVAACAPAAAASHPLRCRALELCFNVALNRLPATNAMADCGRACSPASSLVPPDPTLSNALEEDVRAILEVMVRKQGARPNPVVVGDSVSVAEASVAELMRRLETGDVPGELRGAHVLRLHLSRVHLRLMTRADVDAQVAELRRTANSIVVDAKAAGLVIYVGDVRWAPSLEATWSLQAVVVPAGADADAGTGLSLGRRAPPAPPPRVAEDDQIAKLGEIPTLDLALGGDDGGVPALCAECANGYEKEASQVRAKADGTTLALTYFPGWPHANEPQTSHKAELMELGRKWGILCQRVHSRSHNDQAFVPSPMPWWCRSSSVSRDGEARTELNPSSAGLRLSFGTPGDHDRSESVDERGADTTLSLLPPDSAAAATTWQDTRGRWSEGGGGGADGEMMTVNGLDATVDAVSIRRVWLEQLLLSGDLKRKAEKGWLSGEPKPRRRGGVSLDLNICAAADDDDDGGDSEEEAAPSDLTNEGGCDGGGEPGRLDDSLDSHE
uniref:SMAX1-like nucleotide binding domain-containing protein n=1 Tax=Oryza barthii TaxID=65489 RepID=A0A0D3F4Y8_9ORYZ